MELALHLADEPAPAFQAASRFGRAAGVVAAHRRLCRGGRAAQGKGVVFVKEPARMAYGDTDAVFADTCGNLINLHQE